MKTKAVSKAVVSIAAALILAFWTALPVNALTVYESDGVYHEEGYIFVGESHSVMAAHAVGVRPETLGSDISFAYQWDWSREVTETGNANTFSMKGNLFFVFEGNAASDASRQTSSKYIYSNGAGERGRAVEKIHEIINTNPNIAHWTIISMCGAVAARTGTKEISNYYVNSYRNWMTYEFPEADFYFLSVSTMTRYYKSTADKKVFNNTLQAAFPDLFLDYTDFYASRYPQRMVDTIHWDDDTYIDLIVDVLGKVTLKRLEAQNAVPDAAQEVQTAEYSVTDASAVFYTNDTTVIYSEPSLESAVVLPSCEAGIPIQVTGITSNGFFRVCISPDGAQSFIVGSGLSPQP